MNLSYNKGLQYGTIFLLAFLAFGPILWNGSGFSHPDDIAAAKLRCCGFRPLLALTYQANARWGGWMATNFALHVLASGLVLYLAGPLAAGIFAVHPMAADAVASVSGRSNLILAIAVLAGVITYRRSKITGLILGLLAVIAAVGFQPTYLGTITGAPFRWDYTRGYATSLGGLLAKMVVPIGLSAEPVPHYQFWVALAAILLVIGWLAVLPLVSRRLRLGILLTIAPLLPYFLIRLPNGAYEHRAYLSLAGISILLAFALKQIPRAAYVLIPAFLVMAEARAYVYSSPVTLWEDAAAKYPDGGRAHVNLGAYYAMAGRWYEAEAEFQSAIRVAPEITFGWKNLATLYVIRGKFGDASRVLDAHDLYLKKKG